MDAITAMLCSSDEEESSRASATKDVEQEIGKKTKSGDSGSSKSLVGGDEILYPAAKKQRTASSDKLSDEEKQKNTPHNEKKADSTEARPSSSVFDNSISKEAKRSSAGKSGSLLVLRR